MTVSVKGIGRQPYGLNIRKFDLQNIVVDGQIMSYKINSFSKMHYIYMGTAKLE